MNKLNLVIADNDQAYTTMIANFIQESDYSKRVQLRTFSNKRSFSTFLDQSDHNITLLATPQMVADMRLASDFTCYLLVENIEVDRDDGSPIKVEKYQPMDLLLDQLLLFQQRNQTIPVYTEHHHHTQIVSIYSAVGSAGKTTTAANLAKILAFHGYHVFYLNLEWLGCLSMFQTEAVNGGNYSRLLYYLHIHSPQLAAKLAELIHVDPILNVFCLGAQTMISDIEEMTGESVEHLIDTLISLQRFDYIVVDLDSSLHERVIKTLSMSHQIIWLVLDNVHCLNKSQYLLEELKLRIMHPSTQFLTKIRFLLNKYIGEPSNNFDAVGMSLSGHLPYIPAWKSVKSTAHLLNENVFHHCLTHWFFGTKEDKG